MIAKDTVRYLVEHRKIKGSFTFSGDSAHCIENILGIAEA